LEWRLQGHPIPAAHYLPAPVAGADTPAVARTQPGADPASDDGSLSAADGPAHTTSDRPANWHPHPNAHGSADTASQCATHAFALGNSNGAPITCTFVSTDAGALTTTDSDSDDPPDTSPDSSSDTAPNSCSFARAIAIAYATSYSSTYPRADAAP